MKRSFMPALGLLLALFTTIAFSGCESAISPVDTAIDTAGLNTDRSAAASAVESIAVSVSGMVVVIDGKTVVAYQGIPYYVNGGELTEGATVTVSGKATPILEWDAAGNFLFYGYSVKDGKVTVNS
jgi:hypothetical protein